MIGFENMPLLPLNKFERDISPIIFDLIKNSNGYISNSTIRGKLLEMGKNELKLNGFRIRKIIRHLRMIGEAPIIAAGFGYKIAKTQGEIDTYLISLTGRIECMKQDVLALQKFQLSESKI